VYVIEVVAKKHTEDLAGYASEDNPQLEAFVVFARTSITGRRGLFATKN